MVGVATGRGSATMRRKTIGAGAALVALLADAAAGAPALSPPQDQAFARDVLKELVEINTVQKNGTRVAAEAVARRLKAAGFADADVQILAPLEAPEQANVVVRLRGRGAGQPVLHLAHLDVVEALREDWSVDPFRLTEAGGWYYGRGTSDIKGEAAALVTALARLKREGFAPARDIIVALTADEELAGHNGVEWLLQTHRDLIDAGLVLNADAGVLAVRGGRRIYYGFQTSEKTYTAFTLETTNPGGHSSAPRADNAIYQLAHALARVEAYRFPIHVTATTRAYFAQTAAQEAGQTAADLRAVAADPPDLAAAERLGSNDERRAELRTTCVATLIQGGHSENALPQRARATVQCRVMPGETTQAVGAALVTAVGDPGVSVTEVRPAPPNPESPPTPEVTTLFTRTAQGLWPGLQVMPVMDIGASDSVYTRAAGMPTYGAMSIALDLDDIRAHGKDERIGVEAFQEGVEFTYRLMKAAASRP